MRFMDRGCEIKPGFRHGDIVFVRGRVEGAMVDDGTMTMLITLCDPDGVGDGHDLYIPADQLIRKPDLMAAVKKAVRSGVAG